MDNGSKGAAGVPWAQGIILALLLGVGSLFIADAPYVSDRRGDSPPRTDQRFDDQDVDARLWQDPLGAVQRARDAEPSAGTRAPATAGAASAEAPIHAAARLRDAITAKAADGNAIVLAVMLRGGPYSEFVEQRRRTRYAVLAGLGEMGYAAADSDHLGWIARPEGSPAARQLPQAIPYEWLTVVPDRAAREALDHVLVLWLDDRAFTSAPVARVSALAEALTPLEHAGPASAWRIIGPARSDALLAMTQERSPARPAPREYTRLHFYAATPTVSDQTLRGEAETGEPSTELSRQFAEQLGIGFTRTISNDAQLARALVDELRLRGLVAARLGQPAPAAGGVDARPRPGGYGDLCRPDGQATDNRTSRIAVVAEWDTLYGRSLRRLFRASADADGFCVDRFTYMRGLDGFVPDAGTGSGDDAKPAQGGAGNDDRRKDGSFIERAEGQSQFDYLRRLAKQMRDHDAALRRASRDGRGLQAIGVLGNDVHDKLLVLQALQPEFPTVIFFTTDLDARYLHPREQSWARNLVVASGFGLRLDERIQAGTPPFRDAYQTAEFFATRLALDDARRALSKAQPPAIATAWPRERTAAWRQEDLAEWLGPPRIFEIGRTSAFDFTGRDVHRPERHLQRLAGAQGQPGAPPENCRGERWLNCADIHPPGSQRVPALDTWARWLICELLLLLWVPVLATYRGGGPGALLRGLGLAGLAPQRRRQRVLVVAAFALLQLVLAPLGLALAWPAVADWLTLQGKPLAFTEGISTWPTEFIRLFAFLLGGYLLLRGWRGLERNQQAIARSFFLQAPRAEIAASQAHAEPRLTWSTRLANMFRRDAVEPSGLVTEHATGLSPRVEVLWQVHVVQNRLGARMTRSVVCAALTLGLSLALVLAFNEPRVVPQRGLLALRVHETLHVLVFLMLYLVVIFVADATTLCVRFLRHLRGPLCLWPQAAIRHFEQELAFVDDGLIAHWIDLQFVAARTTEINRLVYYPFILLSLILLSRSPAFDDWQMPLSGKLLALLGALVAVLCAAALRKAAESARANALAEIDKALLRANGRQECAPGAAAEGARCAPTPRQLELLRDYAANLRRGAFARWSQQPVLKALLLPFATVGGSTLLDYLSLANL